MSIDTKQFKLYVIVPTLARIGLYSESAVNLLLGTCAQESQMGTYLKQINGPALGIYQMEPNTHDDIWNNYLKFKSDLAAKVLAIDARNVTHLIINLSYATAIARLQYLRAPEPLPDANNVRALADYYKKYYNTPQGAATTDEFISNYQHYILNG